MIRHAWTVLCDKCFVDRDTNNLRLDTIEQIQMPTVAEDREAVLPYRLEVVSLWYRGDPAVPEQGRALLRFLAPAAKKVQLGEFLLAIDLSTTARMRTRCVIEGVRFVGSGEYRIVVELEQGEGRSTVAEVPLNLLGAGTHGITA